MFDASQAADGFKTALSTAAVTGMNIVAIIGMLLLAFFALCIGVIAIGSLSNSRKEEEENTEMSYNGDFSGIEIQSRGSLNIRISTEALEQLQGRERAIEELVDKNGYLTRDGQKLFASAAQHFRELQRRGASPGQLNSALEQKKLPK